MVIFWKGWRRRHGLIKMRKKKQNKVNSSSEEIGEGVWALALSPRWWFARAAAVGVVVAVSCCFHVFWYCIRYNPIGVAIDIELPVKQIDQ